MRYLCWAMGNKTTSSLKKWLKNGGKDGRSCPNTKGKTRIGTKGLCVIENYDWAVTYYTASKLFVKDAVSKFIARNDGFAEAEDVKAERARKTNEWHLAVKNKAPLVKVWDAHRRNHLERQPGIKSDLLDQLLANSCTSFEGLAASINHWCGKTAIRKWLESHDTYYIYRKEIKPGLTAGTSTLNGIPRNILFLVALQSSCA